MWNETLKALGVPMRMDRDPHIIGEYDAPLGGADRGAPNDWMTRRSGSDMATIGRPSPGPEVSFRDPCALIFYGGAGQTGGYLSKFKESFRKAGISHPIVPSYGLSDGLRLMGVELGDLPQSNDVAAARALADTPAMKAAARQSLAMGGEQFNLGGYSQGGAMGAVQSLAIAMDGGRVDNLILLGAPINKDLLDAVRNNRRIGRVIVDDLTPYGDPLRAGMSDKELSSWRSRMRLAGQFLAQEGHFRLSGSGRKYDARRDAFARSLVQRGVH